MYTIVSLDSLYRYSDHTQFDYVLAALGVGAESATPGHAAASTSLTTPIATGVGDRNPRVLHVLELLPYLTGDFVEVRCGGESVMAVIMSPCSSFLLLTCSGVCGSTGRTQGEWCTTSWRAVCHPTSGQDASLTSPHTVIHDPPRLTRNSSILLSSM